MATRQLTPFKPDMPLCKELNDNDKKLINSFQNTLRKENTGVTYDYNKNVYQHNIDSFVSGHACLVKNCEYAWIDIDPELPKWLDPKLDLEYNTLKQHIEYFEHDYDVRDPKVVDELKKREGPRIIKERDAKRELFMETWRKSVLKKLDDELLLDEFTIVKTCSGGLHFICQYGKGIEGFKPTKDSYLGVYKKESEEESKKKKKAYEFDYYGVDVFVPCSVQPDKNSRCVLLPGSYAHSKKFSNSYIGHYELIHDPGLQCSLNEGIEILCNIVFKCNPEEFIRNMKAMNGSNEKEVKNSQFKTQSKEKAKQAKPKVVPKPKPKEDTYEDLLEDKEQKEDEHKEQHKDEQERSVANEEFEEPNDEEERSDYPSKALIDRIIDILIDKQLEIHDDGRKIAEEISVSFLLMSLDKCVGEGSEITDEHLDEYIERIRKEGNLTSKAKDNFTARIRQNAKNQKGKTWYGLVKMIWYHARDEYYTLPLPKSRKEEFKMSTPEEFLTTNYTINDFRETMGTMKTRMVVLSNLIKCIAFVDNKFIIKKRTEDRVKYEIITYDELRQTLRFKFTLEDKDDKGKPISLTLLSVLNDAALYNYFRSFDTYDILGNDIRTFSLFRPLDSQILYNCEPNVEMIKEWIKFIREDRMADHYSQKAFDHFIRCQAYMLQKKAKASVFFVKYSKEGKTGKSYVDKAFRRMYGEFANTELSYSNMTDGKNGGITDKLYRAWDEIGAPNDHTSKSEVVNFIKQATNDTMTERKHYKEQRATNNYAIDVLNTNDKTAYGVLTSWDDALKTRLCIMRFNDKVMLDEHTLTEEEYKERNRIIAIIDQPNFACSMYTYLMSIDLTKFIEKNRYQRYDWKVDKTIKRPVTDIMIERIIGPAPIENFIIWLDRHNKWSTYRGNRVNYKYICGFGPRENEIMYANQSIWRYLAEYNSNTEGGTPCPYNNQGDKLKGELAKHGIIYDRKTMNGVQHMVFLRPVKLTNMNGIYTEELESIEA